MAAYVPPTIEHTSWDREEKRVLLFSITSPNPDYNPDAERAPWADVPEGVSASEAAAAQVLANRPTITTDYTIPGKPHIGLGLAFLKYARDNGSMLALSWLLEQAVGTAGYNALSAEPDLDPDDLQKIMLKTRDVVLGGLEGPKD